MLRPIDFKPSTPAFFTQPFSLNRNSGQAAPVRLDTPPPSTKQQDEAKANGIFEDLAAGKSLDRSLEEAGFKNPADGIRWLQSHGYPVTPTESENGDSRTTVISGKDGRTFTEYYDFHNGSYYIGVKDVPGGKETTTPVRDGLGRKVTKDYDPETGTATERYEDDLGNGDVLVYVTQRDGTVAETRIGKDGKSETIVTMPDGKKVKLAPEQQAPGKPANPSSDTPELVFAPRPPGFIGPVAGYKPGIDGIEKDLAAGRSIDDIAKARGQTRDQVLAEMAANGRTVTRTTDPKGANGDGQSIEVKDARTGSTTTYYNEDGKRSVRVVEPGGKEVTTSEDGNGRTERTEKDPKTGETRTHIADPKTNTTIDIVIDKEGRRTETTTVKDEKNFDRPVGDDKHLWAVWWETARPRGISWQKFQADNPELFDNPARNPNVVGAGDVVHVNDGAKTTVKVTFNGYTMTTAPDGSVTLTNQDTGTELKIEAGSPQEGLARLLLSINPNSKDPEKAKTDSAIKTAVELVLGGDTLPGLGQTAADREAATQAAIDKYGIDVGADGNPTPQALQGLPRQEPAGSDPEKPPQRVAGVEGAKPKGVAPSGGEWVQARGMWVDPEVAKAMAAEDVTKAKLLELPAELRQARAQLDVWALDPAYKGTMKDAVATLDKALAPYGLRWSLPAPEGSLADAQQKLTEANNRLKEVHDARTEYESAASILDQAIQKGQAAGQEKPARAEADALFASYAGHSSKGDKRLSDYNVGLRKAGLDQAVDEHGEGTVDVPPGTLKPGESPVKITVNGQELFVAPEVAAAYDPSKPETLGAGGKAVKVQIDGQWKWVHPEVAAAAVELASAKEQQELAGKNLGVADAYANAASVGEDMARFKDLAGRLTDQYRANNTEVDLFKPDEEYYTGGGDYMGKVTDRDFIVKDGQLYLKLTFEYEGSREYQLTYTPGDEEAPEWARNSPLNQEWQRLWNGSNQQACGTDGLSARGGPEGLKRAEIDANAKVRTAEISRFDMQAEDIDATIGELTAARDAAVKEHGKGTAAAPDGTMKAGETPVEITVDGRKLQVAPDVAAAYKKGNMDALGNAKAIGIEIDGQWLWVHPEVAAAQMDLDAATDQKAEITKARQKAVSDLHGYQFAMSQPLTFAADEASEQKDQGGLQYDYLEKQRDRALEGYTLQYQELEKQGYGAGFQPAGDLDAEVVKILNLDTTTEEGREARDLAVEEIRNIGGDHAKIKAVPLFYVDKEVGSVPIALIAVDKGDGNTRYVDATGMAFDNLDEFVNNNTQFGEDGRLVVPKDFDVKRGAAGEFDVVQSRKFSALEKVVDPVVGIVTGIATIASFTPLAPVAAPIAFTGGAYLGARAAIKEFNYLQHGGEWNDTESWINIGTVATTLLPMGASGFRAFALAKTGMSGGKAFAGSLGMARMKDTGLLSFGRYGRSLASGEDLSKAMQAMRIAPGKAKWYAWGLDAGAFATGAPLLYTSAKDLYLHGDQMSGLDLANAIVGVGAGGFGTAFGARGMAHTFPRKAGAGTGEPSTMTPGNTGDINPGQIRPGESGDPAEPTPTGSEIAATDGPNGTRQGSSQEAFEAYSRENGLNQHDYEWYRVNGENGEPDTAALRRARGSTAPELEIRVGPDGERTIVPKAAGTPASNTRIGDAAEDYAIASFKARGYTTIFTVKNPSGHGVDVFMYNPTTKRYVVAEIKANSSQLSPDQTLGPTYVLSRMIRAAEGEGSWSSASPADKVKAEAALREIMSGEARPDIRYLVIRYDVDQDTLAVSNPRHVDWGEQEGVVVDENGYGDGPPEFPTNPEWLPGDGVPGDFQTRPSYSADNIAGQTNPGDESHLVSPGQVKSGDPAEIVVPGKTEPGDPGNLTVIQQRGPRQVFNSETGQWESGPGSRVATQPEELPAVAAARETFEQANEQWQKADRERVKLDRQLRRAVKNGEEDLVSELTTKLDAADQRAADLKKTRQVAKGQLERAEDAVFENRAYEVLQWAVPELQGEARFLNGRLIGEDPVQPHAHPDGYLDLRWSHTADFFALEVKNFRKYGPDALKKLADQINARHPHLLSDRRHVGHVVVLPARIARNASKQLDIAQRLNERTNGKVNVEDVFFLTDEGDTVILESAVPVTGPDRLGPDGAPRYQQVRETLSRPAADPSGENGQSPSALYNPQSGRPGNPADLIIPGQTKPGDPAQIVVASDSGSGSGRRAVFNFETGKWEETSATTVDESAAPASPGRRPPKINVKVAAAAIVLARAGAAAFGHITGNWGPFNSMSGQGASTAAYYRSALSKLAWYKHNHGMIDVFDLAARGETDKANAKLDGIIENGPRRGAARLNAEEANDLKKLVGNVAKAGGDYRTAIEGLPPELRDAMPKIEIRNLVAPEKVVEGWLPDSLLDVPEIANLARDMAAEKGEYYGKSPEEVLSLLSTKLDRLAETEISQGPDRPLGSRLSTTQEARQAYRDLYRLLKGKLGEVGEEGGNIDHRAAEKLSGSSMSPDTWLGYFFKLGSFGGALNVLLAWGSKGTPKSGSLVDWGAYAADPVGTLPASFVQWKYLQALRRMTDFKEQYPYPRTPDKEAEFQSLEKKRKFWNTMADYTSVASGFRNLLVGFQFAKQGEPHLAAASFTQAMSSFGWVMVQQTPNIDRAGTRLVEGFRHLGKGDTGPAVRAFKEARKSIAGAAGQQTPTWLKLNPTAKAAIRWSSIGLGIAVPTLVLISKALADENEEQKGPSFADVTWNGLEALAQQFASSFDRFGYAPPPTSSGPAVRSPGTDHIVGLPGGPTEEPSQPGYGFDFDWRSLDNSIFRQDEIAEPLGGRANPSLDRQGYTSVIASMDDSIGGIAGARDADVVKTILLNMDHIPDPNRILPGDRIYLPA